MKLTYTREIADAICDRLAQGEPLRKICETTEGFPKEWSVRYWAKHDVDGFADRFEIARDIGLEGLLDKMIAIASKDYSVVENGVRRVDNAAVTQARLICDTLKWTAAKQMPAKYGDRVIAEVVGKDGGPVQLEAVRSSILDRITRVADARRTPASAIECQPDGTGSDRDRLESDNQDELAGMVHGSLVDDGTPTGSSS